MHAAAHQVALELGRLAHEFQVFLFIAEPHHPFHAGAVVPGSVEQGDLARRRKMLDVALEIPLATFHFAWFFQRDHVRPARIEMLHEALDSAALACSVAALEQDDHLLPGFLHPGLKLEQFHLQLVFLLLVTLARHQVLVRIAALAPVFGQLAVRIERHARPAERRLGEQRIAQHLRVFRRRAGENGLQRIDQLGTAVAGLTKDVLHRHDLGLLCGAHRFVHGKSLDTLAGVDG